MIGHENAHALEDALVEKIEKKIEWLKEQSKDETEVTKLISVTQIITLEGILADINIFNEIGHF